MKNLFTVSIVFLLSLKKRQQCKRSEASKCKLKEITAHVVLKLNFLSCSDNYAQAVSA